MNLSAEQYARLLPFRALIESTVRTSSSTDPGAWETMQQVWGELGQPPANGHCGACALALYRDIWALMIQYEQHGIQS